ncbi:MAG: hypothetical protein ABW173_10580, partial [Sphingomonas sp.]
AAVVTGLQAEAAPVARLAAQVSLASGPLALIGIAYLLLQRTSRREARRFGQTAAAMRAEAAALEATVARLGARIEDDRKAVAEQAQSLATLGEDASLRLAEIGETMRRETQALARQSERLEASAAGLFSDLGVVITDLPRLEAQVDTLASRIGDTGRDAEKRVASLSTELTRLTTEARDADEVAGGAAQRLGAHLARIESLSGAAGEKIDAAADGIARTVDSALSRTAEAVEATRASVDAQGAAVLAMVEQGRAAFARIGAEEGESIEARIAAARTAADLLGSRLAEHDLAGQALIDSLKGRVAAFDEAFGEIDRQGQNGAIRLGETLRALGEEARAVGGALMRGSESADALIARGETLRAVLEDTSGQLGERLPSLLAEIEAEAGRGRATIAALGPEAEAAAAGVNRATRAIGRLDTVAAGQRKAIETLATATAEKFEELEQRTRALDTLLADTTAQAQALTGGASAQLVDALLRVRETAGQAADHASRAFASVIEQAAARLGDESTAALQSGLGGAVEARLAEIAALADRAAAAGEAAGQRLAAQADRLAASAETITRHAGLPDEPAADGEGVSARVARLIDQLNSISIDVTKLLSSDVPDTFWAAYLKGDRGVFTRRAARLVDATEAKEIARRYEDEPVFREQVNRYIHDFEAMLGHILATRDGSILGVTLLSADMGKLYVALAQAIERLRA